MAEEARLPVQLMIMPDAHETAIGEMQQLLERHSGRQRTREDARQAFDNLLGFYTTVCEWAARADREDPGWRARAPAPSPYRRKFSKGRKAKTKE
jgi:hypothetical protein